MPSQLINNYLNSYFEPVIFFSLGAAVSWIAFRFRMNRIISSLSAQQAMEIMDLKVNQASLQTCIQKEREAADDKIRFLENTKRSLADTFQALSASALHENQQLFLDLAKNTFEKYHDASKAELDSRHGDVKQIIAPIRESLEKYNNHIHEMEKARLYAYGNISQQVQSLLSSQQQLQKETANLGKALRTPHMRGRWGEMTLRRVAELAGMIEHCDFFEQVTLNSDNGQLRPDMIVRLPNNRQIVIDAKVPLLSYLEALDAQTEQEAQAHLLAHAKQTRAHIQCLSQKSYWEQLATAPEFVILFIPGENFFSSALQFCPGLIDEGVQKGVIIATPTTLISLLKAVAVGWRQQTISENEKIIGDLGKELYRRVATMTSHFEKHGKSVQKCMMSYNELLASFEKRVLTSARRFEQLGIESREDYSIPELKPIVAAIQQTKIEDN